MSGKQREGAAVTAVLMAVGLAAVLGAGGSANALTPAPDYGTIHAAAAQLGDDPDLAGVVFADAGMEANPLKVQLERAVILDLVDRSQASRDPEQMELLLAERAEIAAQAEADNAAFDAELATHDPEEFCGVGPLEEAAPIGSAGFLANNGMVQFVDGECLAVWAGHAGVGNPGQGAVFVVHGVDMDDVETELILTDEAGSLTVESTDSGGNLILTSNDGRDAVFDIGSSSLTFSSLG
ncbi:MAG: hypothetical protein LBT54_03735 [Bifidobacteriaceae bacterium]|nr:hypothetical protein [Bifidobacteriaceae bacterium]